MQGCAGDAGLGVGSGGGGDTGGCVGGAPRGDSGGDVALESAEQGGEAGASADGDDAQRGLVVFPGWGEVDWEAEVGFSVWTGLIGWYRGYQVRCS